MLIQFKKVITLFVIVSFSFCTTKPPQVSYNTYTISSKNSVDSNYVNFLNPYKQKLGTSLEEVIGFSVYGLFTKKPESVLGNYVADAIKIMAEKKFNKTITAAFVNSGGIRSYIPKGEITTGKIFEIMPFDNVIILQELDGKKLKQFLNHACEKGGWPVSKNFSYSLKEKKLHEAFYNGILINDTSKYIIANSDYVANGGDNTEVLKKISKQNMNYLIRDAIIDYTKLITAEGKPIDGKLENRIFYAQ